MRRHASAIETLYSQDITKIGKTTTTAVAAAGLLENYYTATETLFVRIHQLFGNGLQSDRWHGDLLRKMTMEIPEVRPAAISAETHEKLDELMRFRHFRRYYFHLDYDWMRLEHLIEVVKALHTRLIEEAETFALFVREIMSELR